MPDKGDYGNKMQDALLKRIMQGNNKTKNDAIAIAKSKGWIKEIDKGDLELVLTDKGRNPARNAMRHLEKMGYKYKKDKWVKK